LQEWINLQIDQLLPLRGSVDEMTAVIEKAQPIVEQHGTVEQRGHFFLAMVVRDIARDRYVISETTVVYCRNALAAIQQTDSKNTLGFAHLALGNCLLWSGHLDEAEKHMHAAMDIGEKVGNSTLLVRCLTFLPFIFRRRRQVEQVRNLINRALAMPEARNIGLITGHRAWIAWRDGNMVEAEIYGRASLEDERRQQRINSFHWTGLWPLIGVALAQEKAAEAIHYVRMLLEPTQQPPPEKLSAFLEAALRAWNAGQQEETRSLLQQAVPLAKDMGFL
jgi:hypothetical protein